jgi:hypothetical protein
VVSVTLSVYVRGKWDKEHALIDSKGAVSLPSQIGIYDDIITKHAEPNLVGLALRASCRQEYAGDPARSQRADRSVWRICTAQVVRREGEEMSRRANSDQGRSETHGKH